MAEKVKAKGKGLAVLADLDATALSALLEQQGGTGELLEVSDGLVLRVSARQEGWSIAIPVTVPPSVVVERLEAAITARKSTSAAAAQELVLGFASDDVVAAESAQPLDGKMGVLTLSLPDGQSGTLTLFAAGSYVLQRVILTHATAAAPKKAGKAGKGGGKRK